MRYLKTYEGFLSKKIKGIIDKTIHKSLENNPKKSILKSNAILGVTKDDPGFDITEKYPKYIIWYTTDGLLLLEVIKVLRASNIGNVELKRLYRFKNNVVQKLNNKYTFRLRDIYEFRENILYQSDNLQDCLEQLPIILDTEKYNL